MKSGRCKVTKTRFTLTGRGGQKLWQQDCWIKCKFDLNRRVCIFNILPVTHLTNPWVTEMSVIWQTVICSMTVLDQGQMMFPLKRKKKQIDESINRKLIVNYYDNQLIVKVIFCSKNVKICCFSLLNVINCIFVFWF